jgi:hypothetical protein
VIRIELGRKGVSISSCDEILHRVDLIRVSTVPSYVDHKQKLKSYYWLIERHLLWLSLRLMRYLTETETHNFDDHRNRARTSYNLLYVYIRSELISWFPKKKYIKRYERLLSWSSALLIKLLASNDFKSSRCLTSAWNEKPFFKSFKFWITIKGFGHADNHD